MILFGAVLNGVTVAAGGLLGALVRRGMPERISQTLMKALALCVIYMGISGAMDGENILVAILSLSLGVVLGELLQLEKQIVCLGEWLQKKLCSGRENSFAEGFINCSLLVCVGAMAVIGSLESGMHEEHGTLIAKSIIDGVAALVMGSTMGIGVALSGVLVMLYEGLITVGAQWIEPYLTASMIAEMTCTGSILIVGVGVNMLLNTKIRIMNCVPAIFLAPFICLFF